MKRENIFNVFLIILPILDLLTSLSSRFFPNVISLGMIIKGLVIILSVIYVLFYSVSKHRKNTLLFYFSLLIYFISYFIFKKDLLNINYLTYELNYLFKFSYFPILFFFAINYYDSYEFNKSKTKGIILLSLILYILLISIPTILNINFNSYSNSLYAGSVGWFYSANEVSTILLLLFPIIYIFLDKSKWITIILFIFSLFTISLIGTKVTLFGIIIITFLYFLKYLIKTKKISDYKTIISFLIFVITISFMINNKSVVNMQNNIVSQEEELLIENVEVDTNSFISKIPLAILSDRDKYAYNTYNIYNDSYNNSYLWFGMGFSNTERINNITINKLIEIDFLDIFFHMGILALIILLFPFIYTLKIIINKRKAKFNIDFFLYLLIILLTIGISSTAGHVYLSPSVSIYIVLYLVLLLNEIKLFNNKTINNNKIVLLALHLGYGGVENVIVNKASMLVKEYDVEIVSLYKQKYDIPYNLNKKVKVTYLMNTISNREEFINSLKEKNLFKVIKEGFKSIYILVNKKLLIIKYIIKSDARIIISTRYEFTNLLNKYANDNIIKIYEQHVYDVSHKYIKRLNKLKYIDYIMPVSKDLESNYLTKINNKEKIKYIPLSLNYYPKDTELSKLNNKNIIAIGRLEKVKGYSELIEIMKELVKVDKNIYLNIFGDGSERNNLQKLIDDYKLNENIKIHGFQPNNVINKYLKESSLYVMTSYEESFGLVVIEAMSFGIPCIAFDDAKGVMDVLNKNNGFIINDRNHQKYIDTILEYFNLSLNERKKLGSNGRSCIKKYSFNEVQKEWLKFIAEIKDIKDKKIDYYLKKIYSESKDSYYKLLKKDLDSNKKRFIITVNPETIMYANKDLTVHKILNNNYSYVPDGIAIVKACNYLNIPATERITGIDLMEYLLNIANNKKYKVYFFGASNDVIESLINNIKSKYPNINIVGYSDGYVKDKNKIMKDISKLEPDICFVALGIPNQEKLIYNNYGLFKKGIFIGVGGSFDVLSGCKKRAPKIFIKLNLEWAYRIIKEPFRIKRFINNNIKFFINLLK